MAVCIVIDQAGVDELQTNIDENWDLDSPSVQEKIGPDWFINWIIDCVESRGLVIVNNGDILNVAENTLALEQVPVV